MTKSNYDIIIETAPIDRSKYLLVGLPDVGLADSISLSYLIQEQQMAEPKYMIDVGVCSGGVLRNCDNVLGGIDKLIPVKVSVPDCQT